MRKKLTTALQTCQNPTKIEVIVIDAGGCESLEEEVGNMQGWGKLRVVTFGNGGGRGPCLNYGAKEATGRLYTFCHSDTTLPSSWDPKIMSALDKRHLDGTVSANSCAFSFGIDTSEAGLDGGQHPPGIKAVETTANVRLHLYSLPYGDQVLSSCLQLYLTTLEAFRTNVSWRTMSSSRSCVVEQHCSPRLAFKMGPVSLFTKNLARKRKR